VVLKQVQEHTAKPWQHTGWPTRSVCL